MRGMIVGVALLLAAGTGRAANPGDGSPASASDGVRMQARTYAEQLLAVARTIEESYVKPIAQAKILEAALAGLYEVAREPLPASVKADLAHATDANQLRHILTTARERLGDRDALRDQRALLISLRALPRVLDPYCGIVYANDRRAYGESMVSGVGLDFETTPLQFNPTQDFDMPARTTRQAPQRGPARVALVHPGGPAQRAGVRPGDVLTHIDDKPLDSLEGAELFQRLSNVDAANRAKLKLTLRRIGQDKPLHFELDPIMFKVESVFGVRRRIDQSWDYLLDHERRIGYVRLGFIDTANVNYPGSGSDSEMEDVLRGLKAQGMRGLVFDLRGNPGGFVDPATSIAGLFIKSGTIAVVTDRQEGQRRHALTDGSGLLEGIPTIVLIDEETKGGGEMIAAVLQDHKVAKIAGQRSFGKGSVQKTIYIQELNQLQYKLTTGSFTRPSGKTLHRFPESKPSDDWGIRPNPGLEFPVPPDVAKQIKEWLQQQVLRPGPCRDPLPLDDPDHDPLRQFAWRLLIKQSNPK
jgi:carboxyl-terminal processing protease